MKYHIKFNYTGKKEFARELTIDLLNVDIMEYNEPLDFLCHITEIKLGSNEYGIIETTVNFDICKSSVTYDLQIFNRKDDSIDDESLGFDDFEF